MKKLLLTSAVLFLFSASILLFQISCSKTANANNLGGSSAGKMIRIKDLTTGVVEIWSTSGARQDISLSLPSGINRLSDTYLACDGMYIWVNGSYFNGTINSNKTVLTFDMTGNLVKNFGVDGSMGGDVFVAF
jgi:hypothetical protein